MENVVTESSKPMPFPVGDTGGQAAALTLVSHDLCPYVQRAAIALAEKGVPFRRIYVDLADKPAWFVALSPLGKVPLLHVAGSDGDAAVIFESAVILEYLEDTQAMPLHPADPLDRARHRAWIEFGSAILAAIGRFYSAPSDDEMTEAAERLAGLFRRLEDEFGRGPCFAGEDFSLVDAVYAPIFRYFDTFDRVGDFGILADKPKLAAWRLRLADRPSVRDAVKADYPDLLWAFIARRNSALSARLPCPERNIAV
jgi:glutathione S-transferase